LIDEIEEWTAAGIAGYKEPPKQLRMPLEGLRQKIEKTLVKLGFK